MKKKTYLAPEMKVVVLDQADIICTSGGVNGGNMRFNDGNDYTFGEEDF